MGYQPRSLHEYEPIGGPTTGQYEGSQAQGDLYQSIGNYMKLEEGNLLGKEYHKLEESDKKEDEKKDELKERINSFLHGDDLKPKYLGNEVPSDSQLHKIAASELHHEHLKFTSLSLSLGDNNQQAVQPIDISQFSKEIKIKDSTVDSIEEAIRKASFKK